MAGERLKVNFKWIIAVSVAFLLTIPTCALATDNDLPPVDDGTPNTPITGGRSNYTGWMVTAIIFIILFVITLMACIYLCVERRRRLQQFYRMQHQQQHQRQVVPRKAMDGDGYF